MLAFLSNDLSHMQVISSLQQLKIRLLFSPAADKTSVERGAFLKKISSVFLSLPVIRSDPQGQPLKTTSTSVYSVQKMKKKLSPSSL